MKVLIFEPEYGGHYLQHVSYIIDAYHRKGYQTILATTPEALSSEQYKEYLNDKKEKFDVVKFSKLLHYQNKYAKRMNRFRYLFTLSRLIRKIKPDLIFIPFLDSIFLPYGFLKILGLHILCSFPKNVKIEGTLFRGEYAYSKLPLTFPRWLRLILSSFIVNHGPFSRILCLDELNYNCLVKRQNKHINGLELCPDPMGIKIPYKKKAARKKLNLPINAKMIGCVGGIAERMGVDLLIKAFIKRKPKQNEYLLLVGGQSKNIKNLIKEYKKKNVKGISQLIAIDRFVTQKEFLLSIAAMDVVAVVHPQHIGSSGTLIQAAAAGKPVLGSDFGWIGYMMKKYQLGYNCNVSNSDDLIKGLEWAFSNPSFNKKKAKKFAEKNTVEIFKEKIWKDIKNDAPERKFVFIHIPKTGGISICRALGIPVKGHTPITNYKEKYFSFAFVRNPWDRLVSSFFYLNEGGISKDDEKDRDIYLSKYRGNFKHFVQEGLGNEKKKTLKQQHFKSQFTWVCDEKGNLAVDFIGKFENLEEDFNKVCDRLGIKKKKLSYSNRTAHKHYSEYYDEETKQIVAERIKKDIEYFGYKFERPSFFRRIKYNIIHYYLRLPAKLAAKLTKLSRIFLRSNFPRLYSLIRKIKNNYKNRGILD